MGLLIWALGNGSLWEGLGTGGMERYGTGDWIGEWRSGGPPLFGTLFGLGTFGWIV